MLPGSYGSAFFSPQTVTITYFKPKEIKSHVYFVMQTKYNGNSIPIGMHPNSAVLHEYLQNLERQHLYQFCLM